MSAVLSGVLEKLKDVMPADIGSNRRYSDSDVERYIMLADRVVRERTENRYHQQEITLVTDTLEYTLDSEFIDIVSVEFSDDGSTYQWRLNPVTLTDLDKMEVTWRDSGGARPNYYVVLSAPGTPTAKILVWRPLSSAGSQKIKVTGHGIGTTTSDVPDDVQGKCHVPYVMAMLKAEDEPREAAQWYAEFIDGCESVKARTKHRYSSPPVVVR